MSEPKVITPKEDYPDIHNGIKDIVGRRVLGDNSEVVGKVTDIISKNNKLVGLMVKKGSIRYFIDYDYIKDMYSKSVFLRVNPVIRYLGMTVFDEDGTKLGRVVEINQTNNENELRTIIVKKGFFGKKKTIDASKIEISKKNIILKQ